jgi:cytochrome b561
MQVKNTATTYGFVAKSLHWIVALMIIGAWIVGYYAADLPNQDPQKSTLYSLHKSVGMAILMLVIIRYSWRLYGGSPGIAVKNTAIATAAKTVHYLLYAFMFIQPLSGWAMSSAAGYNPEFFGLFTFPGLVAKDPSMVSTYAFIHNTAAMMLLTLFILHVGGAIFHHFVLKDNTLKRMTFE